MFTWYKHNASPILTSAIFLKSQRDTQRDNSQSQCDSTAAANSSMALKEVSDQSQRGTQSWMTNPSKAPADAARSTTPQRLSLHSDLLHLSKIAKYKTNVCSCLMEKNLYSHSGNKSRTLRHYQTHEVSSWPAQTQPDYSNSLLCT